MSKEFTIWVLYKETNDGVKLKLKNTEEVSEQGSSTVLKEEIIICQSLIIEAVKLLETVDMM